ncbi:MAG: stage III sporulation protein AE [Oscillospiraceae bacterium]|nr:stage III sporulation protein AE [Oscillospiraceae bacterium]
MRINWTCFPSLLLTAAVLIGPAAAAGEEILSAQADALELDRLQAAADRYLDGSGPTQEMDWDQGLQTILDAGRAQAPAALQKAVHSGVLLLVIVLLCGVADGLQSGFGGGKIPDTVAVAGSLAITAVAAADVHALVGLGRGALEGMDGFSKVLLPVVTAACTATGSPSSAAARQLATVLFSNLLMSLINCLLLPLVYAYVASSLAYAALGNEGLKRIGNLLKWIVTSALTGVLLLFVGYLTVSGVIAGSADAAAVKTAKLTISGMVPVVGGILSDAAEAVLAGAGLLKNMVGIFGMLVILFLCIAPFLQLGIHYLTYKVTAALTATVADGRIAGLIDAIGGAFGLILGMTGAGALLLLVSLVVSLSVVTP